MVINTAIIDYGVGNTGSVARALKRIGATPFLAKTPGELADADAIVLPGVGAFAAAMERLESNGMKEALNEAVLNRAIPTLGICLGMQLMMESSDEKEDHIGFGWIKGRVRTLEEIGCAPPRLPHVGWHSVKRNGASVLLDNNGINPVFYFDHSYAVDCSNEIISSTCDYGGIFAAAIEMNNLYGVQFHPELSGEDGEAVMQRFLQIAQKQRGCRD